MEWTNATQATKIHPDEKGTSYDICFWYKSPVTTIQAIVAVVTHHKVNTLWNVASDAIT